MLLSKYEKDKMQAVQEQKKIKTQQQQIIDKEIQKTQDGLENTIFSFHIPEFFNGLKNYDQFEDNIRSGYQRKVHIEKYEKTEEALKLKFNSDVDVFEYLAYLRLTTTSRREMNGILASDLNINIDQIAFNLFFKKSLGYDSYESQPKSIKNNEPEVIDRDTNIQSRMDDILKKNFQL